MFNRPHSPLCICAVTAVALQGMRIEVDFEGGKNAAGIFVHKRLPQAMGNSVAAFAHAMLSGQTQPGVWYPEEKEALSVSCCCCCCCSSMVGWCHKLHAGFRVFAACCYWCCCCTAVL